MALQETLNSWARMILQAILEQDTQSRLLKIKEFCRTFVPKDVSDDDSDHFASTLLQDEEFFLSIQRDINQCVSGDRVESVKESKNYKRVVFTLLPPLDTLDADAKVDLVREVK